MAELAEKVAGAAPDVASERLIQPFRFQTERQNQLLFFLKPEVFLAPQASVVTMVAMALEAFRDFGAQVAGVLLLSGSRLAELGAMDRHYGFINSLSRSASSGLGAAGLDRTRELVGAQPSERVLGGHEFLEAFPAFDPASLDALWRSRPSKKVRSGAYAARCSVDGESIVLVNAFHPAQLVHFTGQDRRIALFLLHSDMPWWVLRDHMIGATFPQQAVPGSIRRRYLERADALGLGEVGVSANCAHLSAGPFEALFELDNFLSGSSLVSFHPRDTAVGGRFAATGLPEGHLRVAMANPDLHLGQARVSLFDATEHHDTRSSVALFQRFHG